MYYKVLYYIIHHFVMFGGACSILHLDGVGMPLGLGLPFQWQYGLWMKVAQLD